MSVYVVKLNYYAVNRATGLTTSHHPGENIEVFTTAAAVDQWLRKRLEEIAGPQAVWIGDPVRENHPTKPSHIELRDYRYILAELPEILPDKHRIWYPDSDPTAERQTYQGKPDGDGKLKYAFRRPDPMAEWLIMDRQPNAALTALTAR